MLQNTRRASPQWAPRLTCCSALPKFQRWWAQTWYKRRQKSQRRSPGPHTVSPAMKRTIPRHQAFTFLEWHPDIPQITKQTTRYDGPQLDLLLKGTKPIICSGGSQKPLGKQRGNSHTKRALWYYLKTKSTSEKPLESELGLHLNHLWETTISCSTMDKRMAFYPI